MLSSNKLRFRLLLNTFIRSEFNSVVVRFFGGLVGLLSDALLQAKGHVQDGGQDHASRSEEQRHEPVRVPQQTCERCLMRPWPRLFML